MPSEKSQLSSLHAILIILSVALATISYLYWGERDKVQSFAHELSITKEELDAEVIEKGSLLSKTEDQEEQLNLLANELEKITGAVNIIEKIQNTDEELLQKYSKVYFLNEHYVPSPLRNIPDENLAIPDDNEKIHGKVWPKLENMLDDASDDNIELRIVSAYRSFGVQSELKSSYRILYGTGANTFSADQGYSEHQLGSTVDFSTDDRGGALDGFEQTDAYNWLKKNAHKYGFILSYPEGNSYYIFEPWHWRYVGIELAGDLNRNGENFYDWDQRKIDSYLVKIFD